MASEPFYSLGGFSVGIPPVQVIDSNGNIVTNILSLTGNVTAGNVYANSYFYANGQPFTGGGGNGVPGGSNTTVQFNNLGNFGGSSNFTFNSTTGLLIVPNVNVTGNANLGSVDNLTITGGNANYVLSTDGAGNLSWVEQTGGGGNGIPGGSNTQIQFNDADTFGGDVGFTYNKTTDTMNVVNIVSGNITTSGTINATGNASAGNITTSGTINATGNVSAGNISTVGVVTASGNITSNSNINVSGTAYLGNISTTGLASITTLSVGTSANLGAASNITITGGSNGYFLRTDGAGNLSWQAAAGGNGSPGGNNTQIQYNDSGVFGGSPFLTFNDATNTVQVAGNMIANTMQLGAGVYKFCTSEVYFATTASTSPNQLLYSIPTEGISGADFHIIATDTVAGTRQSSKISSVVYGNVVQYNEYAGMYINGGIGSFSVSYNSGDILSPPSLELKISPDSLNQTVYKMLITVFDD